MAHYNIPEDSDENTLIELHNEILMINPAVRCHFKWGDITEYSVLLSQADVEYIAGREIATNAQYRLVVGIDTSEADPLATAIEVYDAEQNEWVAAEVLNASAIGTIVSAEDTPWMQRAYDWSIKNHPALDALIQIDWQIFKHQGKL